jgi:cell division septal protein FtsQ
MEITKRERKRRGNSRYYLFFIVTLLLIVAFGLGLWFALINVNFFDLKKIEIAGNTAVPDSLIYKLAKPYLGMNLIALPGNELKHKLSAISRVKEVKLRKKLLHSLQIVITERKGFLYLKTLEGDLFPLDSEGVVLARYSQVYSEDLPIYSTYLSSSQVKKGKRLINPGLNRILNLQRRIVKEAPDFLTNISEYYMIDNTINMIDAKRGTRIIPSDEDMAKQLARYQFVQENGNINKNSVVDLRFKNQVVVKAGNKL